MTKKYSLPGGPDQLRIAALKVNKEIYNKLMHYSMERKLTISEAVKQILAEYFDLNDKN